MCPLYFGWVKACEWECLWRVLSRAITWFKVPDAFSHCHSNQHTLPCAPLQKATNSDTANAKKVCQKELQPLLLVFQPSLLQITATNQPTPPPKKKAAEKAAPESKHGRQEGQLTPHTHPAHNNSTVITGPTCASSMCLCFLCLFSSFLFPLSLFSFLSFVSLGRNIAMLWKTF